jgi:hypothetical protein
VALNAPVLNEPVVPEPPPPEEEHEVLFVEVQLMVELAFNAIIVGFAETDTDGGLAEDTLIVIV